jgi:hypothetical protein
MNLDRWMLMMERESTGTSLTVPIPHYIGQPLNFLDPEAEDDAEEIGKVFSRLERWMRKEFAGFEGVGMMLEDEYLESAEE